MSQVPEPLQGATARTKAMLVEILSKGAPRPELARKMQRRRRDLGLT